MSMDLVVIFFSALARCSQWSRRTRQGPASARETPASTMNRPIKTRRLKKADCEADFFFMELLMMWMEF